MKRRKQASRQRTIRAWKQARAVLEAWRKKAAEIRIELKRARVIDVVPIDFIRGEPFDQKGQATKSFRGNLIYSTHADITVRRRSGAILVIDNYEIASLSDGKTRFEPA